MTDNLSGQSIKGYDLLERIGNGGFGAVYRAYQSTIGREVAVKIILPGFANRPGFIRRFEAEAQLIARLEHLHIVPLYDYWRDPDGAYLVMRWLRGGSLKDALRAGPFTLGQTGLLLDQVAAALASAHAHQVVHRDLKPSNILLDEEGNAYLADFGIALDLLRSEANGASGNNIAGSPAYLSPEQARREPVTPRADIYSLGITLYETLTNTHPFPGKTGVERLFKQLDEPLPRVEIAEAPVRDAVNEVLQRATAKNPAHRYPDALALAAAFRKAAKLDEDAGSSELVEVLTLREQEILQQIVAGRTNRQIARELFIELSTVKWHIRQLYGKLGVRSRRQAISKGRELELLLQGEADEGEQHTSTTSINFALPAPVNPYKGVRAFAAVDSRHFFGREAMADKLLARLAPDAADGAAVGHGQRFLAIVGPSGSGKSSLVKAGLIPRLWQGEIPGSDRWFVVEMAPGARPLDELEVGLIRVAADQAENIRQQLERDRNGLLRAAELILPRDDSELVLVVDQFEELFTLVGDEATRLHFLEMLAAAVGDPRSRVRVIITLRADYYDRPLHYPEFGALLQSHMETLLPLSASELERAIARPAQEVAVTYEPGLVATIIDDVLYQPGALPLLQYALTELFEACVGPGAEKPGRMVTHEAYQTIGGAGALTRRAEELYQEQDAEGREAIRQLFLRLVSVEELPAESTLAADGSVVATTRRRVSYVELTDLAVDTDLMEELIDSFSGYRLLTLDHDPATRRPTVEVAHEALLQQWERLRGWLEASREDLYQHQRLQALSEEWLENKRDVGLLLRQTRLDQVASWVAGSDMALTGDERAFLEASLAAREEREAVEQVRRQRELETAQQLAQIEARRATEQALANRRLRGLAAALALLFLIATAAAFVASREASEARVQARLATARELAAAAISNLTIDPERSILLALRAAETTLAVDGTVLPEAEDALHRALQASRIRYSVPGSGAVAYSGDGRLLATSLDNDAVLRDANTGEELLTLSGHEGLLGNLAFSGDSRLLATTSLDNTVRVWDVESGALLLTVHGPSDPVELVSPALTPGGEIVAATAENGTIYAWQVASGRRLLALRHGESREPVGGLAFSPDGSRLVTAGGDNTARIWSIPSGRELLTLVVGDDVNDVAFSPDGERVATASTSGSAQVWDLARGEVSAQMPHGAFVFGVDFSRDGQRIATGGLDGAARVWDAATGRELVVLVGHTAGIGNVAFSADGSHLATGSGDGTTRVWGITVAGSREWLTVDAHDNMVFSVDYSPDGSRLATASVDGTASVWDAVTGRELFVLTGTVRDTESGRDVVMPRAHDGEVYRIAFNPQGTRLVTAGEDGIARIWDATSGAELANLAAHEYRVYGADFSPDGALLATSDMIGIVKLWNVESGALVRSIPAHVQDEDADPLTSFVFRVNFSPDGRYLATAGWDRTAAVWDVVSGDELFRLEVLPPGPYIRVNQALFNADSTRLITASGDGAAKVWDIEAALGGGPPATEPLLALSGHTGFVWDVALSPDESRLATVGFEGLTKVWDASTGEQLLTVGGYSVGPDVAFSPDGTHLLTAGFDGAARVHVVAVEELMELARSRLTRSWRVEECRRFLHTQECPEDR